MVGVSAAPDLIDRYLAELCAGLRVSAGEAELILAEAEDHLRETAAAGRAGGMSEAEAQRAAISGFGPVRAVVRAYRRRTVTPGDAAMAAWKLAGLLATAVGAGGLAGMGMLEYSLRASPFSSLASGWMPGLTLAPELTMPGTAQRSVLIYAAMAAGGLILLTMRWLARRGSPGRDPLSKGVTAGCFLLAAALLWVSRFLPLSPRVHETDGVSCSSLCDWSEHMLSPGVVVQALAVFGVLAVAGMALLATRLPARRGAPGGNPPSPRVTATCFALASALLIALNAGVMAEILGPLWWSWLRAGPDGQVTISAAPTVSGGIVAVSLAVAAGYGAQAVFTQVRIRLDRVRSAASLTGPIAA